MKNRIMLTTLAALLVIGICGCQEQKASDETLELVPLAPVETTQAASESSVGEYPQLPPASSADAAAEVEEEPGPDEEDLVLDGVLYDAALAYVGASVEELYDAIGEPESSQYASSCEQDNADDGMLFYDGFYVWTLRTDEGETVRAVYLDE